MCRRLTWAVGLHILAALALTACVSLTCAAQQSDQLSSYPPPGKLVDVGGWRIHINCTSGTEAKRPTVVLESGSGDFSFDWALVQPGVARFARVCSYDRAGHAWSDLGPRPRTMKQITYELHTALIKAGIAGPYVLVGQSIGGLLVRTYASQYPKEIAGMVLVDSTSEDTQLFINGKLQRMRELSQGRPIPTLQTVIPATDKELSGEQRQKIEEFMKMIGPPKIDPPYTKLPPEAQKQRLWARSQPKHFAADDDPYWGEEFAEIYTARQKQEHPLGDIPLVVLVGGKEDKSPPGFSAAEWTKLNEEKRQQKIGFASLSRNGKVVVDPQSGHHIQLDNPELVIRSIREVVEAARRGTRLTGSVHTRDK